MHSNTVIVVFALFAELICQQRNCVHSISVVSTCNKPVTMHFQVLS